MNQQRVNMLVFGFIGVIVGLLLAAFSGYDTIRDASIAMIAGGLFGGLVGANWTPTTDQRRRRRTTSR